MKIWPVKKIILFGGSIFLLDSARLVKKSDKFEILVFSSKRHLDEVVEKDKTLGQLLKEVSIPYFDTIDINSSKRLRQTVDKYSLGIAFGAAWTFEKKTVDLFSENYLLDFIGIDLPRYKGGAHYSWQILHQNKTGVLNLQIIEGGEETFHRGKVIKTLRYSLPKSARIPKDFFDYNALKTKVFLSDFLKDLAKRREFEPSTLDEADSSFYPFLSTDYNGWIDWTWNGSDIAFFINAFGTPYKGASTLYKGKRVFLKDCKAQKAQEAYHPFSSGIIVRREEGCVFVASVGNLLKVEQVLDGRGINILGQLSLGDRFYTRSKELERSKSFNAIYGVGGLIKNNG